MVVVISVGGHICGRQRAACRSQLSPSTMCVSGIILRLSGLVVNTFTLNRLSEPSLWPQVTHIYMPLNKQDPFDFFFFLFRNHCVT